MSAATVAPAASTAAPTNRIAFQGEPGAYSHEACRAARPQKSGTFMQRLEQRWEQRRHGGSGY